MNAITRGILVLAAGGGVAGAVLLLSHSRSPAPSAVPSVPSTRAVVATLPAAASQPAAATRRVLTKYLDWLHEQPDFADAQPEKRLLPLFEAAHIPCPDGAIVDSEGAVWVVTPEGPSFAEAAVAKASESVRITRDPLVAVFWLSGRQSTKAFAVAATSRGGFELLLPDGSRKPLARSDYDWSRARARQLEGDCIVPCGKAVVALQPGEAVLEQVYEFAQVGDEPVQLSVTDGAVLAFLPQHRANAIPAPVVTFIEGAWKTAGLGQDWRGPLLHLRPLADPAFVQFVRPGDEPGTVKLEILARTRREVNREEVLKLVKQLASEQPAERDAAERRLDVPDNWPLIEELLPQQAPEARLRMMEILARRNTCSAGRWEIRGQRLALAQRLPGGAGAIFVAPEGLSVPDDAGASLGMKPAFLAMVEGEVSVLSAPAEAGLTPGARIARAADDWLITKPGVGSTLVGMQQQLTRSGESRFSEFRGIGASAYVFGEPGKRKCLLIDRLVPDPSPRLPVWEIMVSGGQTGWDSANWPAMKKGGAWSLQPTGWKALGREQPFFEELPKGAATQPVLTCTLGSVTLSRAGRPDEVVEVPEAAQGSLAAPLAAVRGDAALYLYNEPGRVAEFIRTAKGWSLWRTYRRDLPLASEPRRFWVDPAGRLCLAWNSNLAIMFPGGRIPPEILDLMPHEQVQRLQIREDDGQP